VTPRAEQEFHRWLIEAPRGAPEVTCMSAILSAEIEKLIAAEIPDLVRLRHDLHAHAQGGFEEVFASRVVQENLGLADVPFQGGVAATGVVGWLVPPGPAGQRSAVGLRADMDAQPIQEETGQPYASQVRGRMHACGHDGHVAILLGAARVLSRLRAKLPRPVKFLFQPAEEALDGGRKMQEAGALEDKVGGLKVGSIFALHGWGLLPQGAIGTRVGPLMAAADRFEIVVQGKGGHGAGPQYTEDPIVAAAQIVTALQTVVSRNVDPVTPAVVSVCRFQAGTAFNIIPQTALLAGTVRTLEDATADKVHRRISGIAQHVASAMGCSADVQITRSCPVTSNDAAATELVLRVAREVVGAEAVHVETNPEMGAEDFSFFSRQVPGCYFLLGMRPRGQAAYPAHHSPFFDFNDEVILPGVRMMVALALASGEAPGA
jgi:amidohydrolase